MKVLITGATGHVGAAVSRALAGQYQLVYVGRSDTSFLPEGATYKVDLAEPAPLAAVFAKEKPDVVIHLAAIMGAACEENPALARQINAAATARLAELASEHGVQVFVFASSAAVYTQEVPVPTDELHNVAPHTVYGKTKLEAEQLLQAIAQRSKTRFVAFRIFNIYGPGFTNSLVYKLAHSQTGNPVELAGLDSFSRDYIYIDDVVKVLTDFSGLKRLHEFFVCNLASGTTRTNTALIKELQEQDITPQYTLIQGRQSFSWADITRLKNQLGFQPRTELQGPF